MTQSVEYDWDDSDKKAFERNAISLFIELSNNHYRVHHEREHPDFIIAHDEELVGLEVAQLTDEDIARAHRTAAHLAQKNLLSVLERSGKCLLVIMYTQENFKGFDSPESRQRFVENAARFIAFAADHLPPPIGDAPDQDDSGEFFLANGDRCAEAGLPEIHQLQVSTRHPIFGCAVEILPVLTYYSGDHSLIEKVVAQKEAKRERYVRDTGLAKQWLLLVTGVVGAQPVVSDMVGKTSLQTGFERVYLLDVQQRTITSL